MITVHHLNLSRSQRVLWLLEELELPYEIQSYARNAKTMLAPRSLREVHPLGKSPVITDGETTLAESGAILEYLVERYGKGGFAPVTGTPERVRYSYWMHYAEGSLMPFLLMKLVFDRLETPAVPLLLRPVSGAIARKVKGSYVLPQIKNHLDYVESQLTDAWFAGKGFTAADIQMSYPVEAALARGLGGSYPNMARWAKRIAARPAYQRAQERGGPFGVPG